MSSFTLSPDNLKGLREIIGPVSVLNTGAEDTASSRYVDRFFGKYS